LYSRRARTHTHIWHETLVSIKERGMRQIDVERVGILDAHTHTHTYGIRL